MLELSKLSVDDLTKFDGIGEAKAISIISALELGNRKRATDAIDRNAFIASINGFDFFSSFLVGITHEEFHAVLLNKSNKLIKHFIVSKGSIDGTVVDVKLIIKEAMMNMASGIIVCHNHPSGNINPSIQDENLTKKIKNAASFFDIKVLDHLIIGDNKYFSFADEGLI